MNDTIQIPRKTLQSWLRAVCIAVDEYRTHSDDGAPDTLLDAKHGMQAVFDTPNFCTKPPLTKTRIRTAVRSLSGGKDSGCCNSRTEQKEQT